MRARAWRGVGLALLCAIGWAPPASAQELAQGFAVERFSAPAPGGGWLTNDDLRLRGLGGALSITLGCAHAPLRVASADGSQRVAVVSDQAFAELGAAVTYQRLRVYANFASPLAVLGQGGVVGAYRFAGPLVSLAENPDTITDVRLGIDARLFGEPDSPFRAGVGAQLFIPSGDRNDYVTDGTLRGMARLLIAGDQAWFSWAGHLGVHVRPLDDAPAPGSPRGSELLFGVAAGVRIPAGLPGYLLVVGPELSGVSALGALFSPAATGLEALLGARLESAGDEGPHLRVKLAVGAGLAPAFGVPEWRVVLGAELFGQVLRGP